MIPERIRLHCSHSVDSDRRQFAGTPLQFVYSDEQNNHSENLPRRCYQCELTSHTHSAREHSAKMFETNLNWTRNSMCRLPNRNNNITRASKTQRKKLLPIPCHITTGRGAAFSEKLKLAWATIKIKRTLYILYVLSRCFELVSLTQVLNCKSTKQMIACLCQLSDLIE